MNNRRMFSNRIANSARFLQMPTESQLLYFHMVLRADDDGVLETYPLMKLLGMGIDNFKVLVAKGFIKQLNEDQVVVITDWREHNVIRPDRKVDSIYKNLLLTVAPDIQLLEAKPRSDVEDNSRRIIENDSGPSTGSISQVKLSQVKLINNASKTRVSSPIKKKMKSSIFGDLNPMDLSKFVKWMRDSKQKHMHVIAEWAEAEEPAYTTRGQWSSFVSRNVRPAMKLIGFNPDQLQKAYDKLQGDIKHKDPKTGKEVGFITKYTLETLEKYL